MELPALINHVLMNETLSSAGNRYLLWNGGNVSGLSFWQSSQFSEITSSTSPASPARINPRSWDGTEESRLISISCRPSQNCFPVSVPRLKSSGNVGTYFHMFSWWSAWRGFQMDLGRQAEKCMVMFSSKMVLWGAKLTFAEVYFKNKSHLGNTSCLGINIFC